MPEQNNDASQPVQAGNSAPNENAPKEDSIETKSVFRVLAASSFTIGIGLFALGIASAITMLALFDSQQNPLQGISAFMGWFLAVGVAGVGVLFLLANLFAWVGVKIFKTRKAGILILAVVILYVGVQVFDFVGSVFSSGSDPVNQIAEETDGRCPLGCPTYPNGQIREELTNSFVEKDGRTISLSVYEAWHENGQLAEQTHFADGEPDGTERFWDESGQLRRETIYSNGIQIGLARQWTEAGIETTGQ